MEEKVLFTEKQKFTQWWIWLIIGISFFILGYLFIKEINNTGSLSESKRIGEMIAGLIVVAVIFLLFFSINLKTTITNLGIKFTYFPFILKTKTYLWQDVDQVYTRKYSPIWEYGGWGLRYGFKNGVAYNVSGNNGIQIVLKNGKKVLIGTRKMEEANRILEMTTK
jgi:hypothetical protein